MDFFGIIYDIKNGKKVPYSKTYFDTLFAAKLKELGVKTITGVLPLTFTTSETALRSWTIYGNDFPHEESRGTRLPLSFYTDEDKLRDWTIYGNNTQHNYSAEGTLPLTFTTHTAGAVDNLEIEGNNDVGKNLLEITATSTTINGVTFTVDKTAGTITANGTASANARFDFHTTEMTVNATDIINGIPDGATSSTYYILAEFENGTNAFGSNLDNTAIGDRPNFTPRVLGWRIYVISGQTVNNLVFKPMLRPADTSPDFEPYQIGVGQRTKNLIEITAETQTINGVTFTINKEAGTMTANGTASANAKITVGSITLTAGESYELSGNIISPSSTADRICALYVNQHADLGIDYGYGATITSEETYTNQQIAYMVYKGKTVNNAIIKPMLRKADTSAGFIPFGYEIPLTISQTGQTDKTYDIYIGDSPLLSGDYADYESSKIYKAKRIHEDTVTIDGIVWDILDYDHDEVYKADGTRAKHSVTIQTHDCVASLQFCARQALFIFPYGCPIGTYHFKVVNQPWYSSDVGKSMQFTLTKAIPEGGQLVINNAYNATMIGTTISSYASPSTTTALESVTMSQGTSGTNLGDVAKATNGNTNSIQRALLGSNNYQYSAMRQWLNSNGVAGSVWTPQTPFDRPPSWASNTAGFLNGIDADVQALIGECNKITALNTVTDGGGSWTSREKVFLLSRTEVYGGNENNIAEGVAYPYYSDYSDLSAAGTGDDSNRIKYRNGSAEHWWLRSPYSGYANGECSVYPSGNVTNYSATYSIGVAPAFVIPMDDIDDWVKQTFYTEVDADLPTIELFSGDNIIDTSLFNKPEMAITGVDYVGVGEYVNGQWQIPLTVSDGTNTTIVNIPIDAPLTASDTATKASTGVDIATADGTNTIGTTLENKPQMLVYYGYKGVGEHSGDTWELNFITSANGNQQLTKITMDKPLRAGETLTSEQAGATIPTYADAENTLSLYPSAAGYGNPEMSITYKGG